jgi:hypothetical protein
MRVLACSHRRRCRRTPQRRYLSTQAAARLDGFEALCASRRAMHPLLAARLACAVAQGAAHPSALDALCYARGAVDAPPPRWAEEHAALRAAFDAARLPAAFLTLPWYAGVLARLHLNVFRVDVPRTDVTDINALARAIAGAQRTRRA